MKHYIYEYFRKIIFGILDTLPQTLLLQEDPHKNARLFWRRISQKKTFHLTRFHSMSLRYPEDEFHSLQKAFRKMDYTHSI